MQQNVYAIIYYVLLYYTAGTFYFQWQNVSFLVLFSQT